MKKEEEMEFMHQCYCCDVFDKESAMSSYLMPDGQMLWICDLDGCEEFFATSVIGG
jgi:hypothetical protein